MNSGNFMSPKDDDDDDNNNNKSLSRANSPVRSTFKAPSYPISSVIIFFH